MQSIIDNPEDNTLWNEWIAEGPPGLLNYVQYKLGDKKRVGIGRKRLFNCIKYYRKRWDKDSKWIRWNYEHAMFTIYMRRYLSFRSGTLPRHDLREPILEKCQAEYNRMILE